jgi:flagellum-specific ATP synthase
VAAALDLTPYRSALRTRSLYRHVGRVEQVVGLIIDSNGPQVGLGDLCEIRVGRNTPPLMAEAVGFRGERVQLMCYGPMGGIAQGAEVVATHEPFVVPVGEGLLGRVIDARGRPIDDRGELTAGDHRAVVSPAPKPLARARIDTLMGTGVRAIDGFLSCGRGQRVGIFSGSGVGKSTLLGMIAREANTDVNVIALIGERGREVREFLERDLGVEGLARSVVVVATSDESALVRVKAAQTAMTIAEAFRAEGKHVLLLADSITRTAMALREIGLAVGEPPTSRGYTPSVFAFLAPYLERAGTERAGSITLFATVLVEGDDVNDPIGDAVRGILDGHIVLSRDLAARSHYPPIDVLGSVSRVMPDVVSPAHLAAAATLRALLATYRHFEDLVAVGAYRSGQNKELDRALAALPSIERVLRQGRDEATPVAETVNRLVALAADASRAGGAVEEKARA